MYVQTACSLGWLDIAGAPIFKKVFHAMEISVLKSCHYNVYSKVSYSD